MSLHFNGCGLRFLSFRKDIETKVCYTALSTAGALVAGFLSIFNASAESIELTRDNFQNYVIDEDGTSWLESDRRYVIHNLSGMLSVNGRLGLRSPDTSLAIISSPQQSSEEPGVFINDFIVNEGLLEIKAGPDPYIFSTPYPSPNPYVSMGNLSQNGGRISVTSLDSAHERDLETKSITVNQGEMSVDIAKSSRDILGLRTGISSREFLQTAGNIVVRASGTDVIGIAADDHYSMRGGNLSLTTANDAIGLKAKSISISSNDDLSIDARSKSTGIFNPGDFVKTSGRTFITASDGGSKGLHTHNFVMNGGFLSLESADNAYAIAIGDEENPDTVSNFTFNRGRILIKGRNNAETGYAVFNRGKSHALFGSESVTELVADVSASGQLATGLMSFDDVIIEKGARLEFSVSNAAVIDSTESINVPFLIAANSEIKGEFTTKAKDGEAKDEQTPDRQMVEVSPQTAMQGSKLLYDYSLVKTAEDDIYLYKVLIIPHLKPENPDREDIPDNGDIFEIPSDRLTGNNYLAAAAAQAILWNHDLEGKVAGYDLLKQAYDRLYNSNDTAEIERHARGLHSHQTTRFPSLITTSHDRFSYSFQRELTRAASQPHVNDEVSPEQDRNTWAGWVKPLGGSEKYRAYSPSYRNLDINYGGLTIGSAGRYRKVTTGMAIGFMQGRMKAAEGYSADVLNLLFTTGLTTDSFNISKSLKPFLDMGLGYGWSRFDQNRYDTLGGRNHSIVRADSLRFTLGIGQEYFIRQREGLRLVPKATLDYTYIRQGQYREYGGNLPLSVAPVQFSSLQPKIGSELLWAVNPQLAVNGYAYYRYEILDNRSDLESWFVAMPDYHFVTTGENTGRSSVNLGLEMTYQVFDSISLSGSYDLLSGKGYNAHQLYIQGNARF